MTDSAESEFLEQLIGECADRMANEGMAALAALCAEHPEHAEALRAAMQPLLEFGIFDSEPEASASGQRKLGEFEILREIGRGGMGVVFEARQPSLERRVALKVLHAHLTLDDNTIERFRREGRTAAGLNHPGIVEVYGSGEQDGHAFLAMEFVVGAPLDQVLQKLRGQQNATGESALPDAVRRVLSDRGVADVEVSWAPRSFVEGAAVLVCTVALALHHAHESGVVHRDVKPSNILIRPDGQPVLTDFGLARSAGMPGLTLTGAVTGTPFYMSPEQARGQRHLDRRSDVFSLGATLYEILTLTRPFPGDSSQQVMRDILVREPLDPQRLRPQLPGDLAAIVLKALAKDPAERYPTAAAMAEDLQAFLELRAVTARKASAMRRLRRWMRREPLKAALVAVLALGVPAIAGLAGFLWAQQPLVELAERQRAQQAAEASLIQGHFEMMHGRHQQARQYLAQALDNDATHLEALVGLCLSLSRDPEGARRALELLGEHMPPANSPRSLLRLQAWCFEVAGERERAESILANLGAPEEPMEHYLEGNRIYRSGDYRERAEAAYQSFLEAVVLSKSPSPIFHHRLAVVAGDLRDEGRARMSAETLARFWPDSAFAWEGIGLALEGIDPEAAVTAYRQAIALDPSRGTIYNNLGGVLFDSGDDDGAIEAFHKALELDGSSDVAHYGLARVYLSGRRDPDKAVEHAGEAVRAAPHIAANHRLLVRCLTGAGRFEAAAEAAEDGLRRLPEAGSLWRELARVHMRAGNPAAAAEACARALARNGEDPSTLRLLAEARRDQGDHAGAAEVLLRRARWLRTDGEAWRELALAQLAKLPDGSRLDAQGALQSARRAEALATEDDPYVLLTLGMALHCCGKTREGLAALESAEALARQPRWRGDQRLHKGLQDVLTGIRASGSK